MSELQKNAHVFEFRALHIKMNSVIQILVVPVNSPINNDIIWLSKREL